MVLFKKQKTNQYLIQNLGIPDSTNSTYTMTKNLNKLLLAFGFSGKHFTIVAMIDHNVMFKLALLLEEEQHHPTRLGARRPSRRLRYVGVCLSGPAQISSRNNQLWM